METINKSTKSLIKRPDATKHFMVSMIKSFTRILACVCLAMGSLQVAGLVFLTAEILGIVEELVN